LSRYADGFTQPSASASISFSVSGQRAGEGNEIGLRQQRLEVGHRVHRIRVSSAGTRVAADADHTHVESLGELREPGLRAEHLDFATI
jgi:hypothetical protein